MVSSYNSQLELLKSIVFLLFSTSVLTSATANSELLQPNLFPVFSFSDSLWHPSFSKKYLDSENFIIIHREPLHQQYFVELLQIGSTTESEGRPQQQRDQEDEEDEEEILQIEGLNCDCNFTKIIEKEDDGYCQLNLEEESEDEDSKFYQKDLFVQSPYSFIDLFASENDRSSRNNNEGRELKKPNVCNKCHKEVEEPQEQHKCDSGIEEKHVEPKMQAIPTGVSPLNQFVFSPNVDGTYQPQNQFVITTDQNLQSLLNPNPSLGNYYQQNPLLNNLALNQANSLNSIPYYLYLNPLGQPQYNIQQGYSNANMGGQKRSSQFAQVQQPLQNQQSQLYDQLSQINNFQIASQLAQTNPNLQNAAQTQSQADLTQQQQQYLVEVMNQQLLQQQLAQQLAQQQALQQQLAQLQNPQLYNQQGYIQSQLRSIPGYSAQQQPQMNAELFNEMLARGEGNMQRVQQNAQVMASTDSDERQPLEQNLAEVQANTVSGSNIAGQSELQKAQDAYLAQLQQLYQLQAQQAQTLAQQQIPQQQQFLGQIQDASQIQQYGGYRS